MQPITGHTCWKARPEYVDKPGAEDILPNDAHEIRGFHWRLDLAMKPTAAMAAETMFGRRSVCRRRWATARAYEQERSKTGSRPTCGCGRKSTWRAGADLRPGKATDKAYQKPLPRPQPKPGRQGHAEIVIRGNELRGCRHAGVVIELRFLLRLPGPRYSSPAWQLFSSAC